MVVKFKKKLAFGANWSVKSATYRAGLKLCEGSTTQAEDG